MSGIVRVQVISGLGSRMRVVLAAVGYCKASGKRLIVNWPIRDRTVGKPMPFLVRLDELWSGPYAVECGSGAWTSQERDSPQQIEERLGKDGNLKIRSDNPLVFGRWCDPRFGTRLGTDLLPTGAVEGLASRAIKAFRGRMIGVHVRGVNAREDSPKPEWYFGRLASLPDWPIYLATDSGWVREAFDGRYGDRVQAIERAYDCYGRAELFTVAAELHVLAACDWVIGSAGSSYSEIVCTMRGGRKVGSLRVKERYVIGGRYEDAWNPANEAELATVLEEHRA